MVEQTQPTVTDVMSMYEAFFFEFPLASVKWGVGAAKEQEVTAAVWKGYDTWVRLAGTSINEIYKNSLFGEIAVRSLDRGLRWQRFNTVVTDAFFAGLWPAVGLPTATAIQIVTKDLQALTARLTAQDTQIQALRDELHSLTDQPTPRKKRAASARLAMPLNTLPAKLNGHRTVTFPPATV